MSLLCSIATFALATSVTPGPNNLMLMASGVNFGFKRSIPHATGITIGFLIMLLSVGFGLNALFKSVPQIYPLMKVLGFGYLLYLSWRVATSDALPARAAPGEAQARPLGFLGAAAFQWVNPKAWMIAVSFSSNYLPQSAGALFVVLCCVVVAAVNFPSIAIWLWMGTRLENALRDPRKRQVFNWLMAALLIASMLPVLWF